MNLDLETRAAYQVTLEPGDRTRYVFVIVPLYDGYEYNVQKLNGAPFRHRFERHELDALEEHAPEVLRAPCEAYQATVEANPWLTQVIMPEARKRRANAWTYVAALIASVGVRREEEA